MKYETNVISIKSNKVPEKEFSMKFPENSRPVLGKILGKFWEIFIQTRA